MQQPGTVYELHSDIEKRRFVKEHPQGAIIFYGRANCGHCQHMLPIFTELARQYPTVPMAHLELTRVNIDNEPESDMIHGVPAFFRYSNGQLVDNFAGASQDRLVATVQAVQGGGVQPRLVPLAQSKSIRPIQPLQSQPVQSVRPLQSQPIQSVRPLQSNQAQSAQPLSPRYNLASQSPIRSTYSPSQVSVVSPIRPSPTTVSNAPTLRPSPTTVSNTPTLRSSPTTVSNTPVIRPLSPRTISTTSLSLPVSQTQYLPRPSISPLTPANVSPLRPLSPTTLRTNRVQTPIGLTYTSSGHPSPYQLQPRDWLRL